MNIVPEIDYSAALTAPEKLLFSLGLGNPWKRFAFLTAATGTLLLTAQPAYAFTESGQPRPFTGADTGQGVEPTLFPWWGTALTVGLFGATFF